jgi:ABC-type transporter Mla subunit MlaD
MDLYFLVDAPSSLISHFDNRIIAFAFAYLILILAAGAWLSTRVRHRRFLRLVGQAAGEVRVAAAKPDWSAADRLAQADQAFAGSALKDLWTPYLRSVQQDPSDQRNFVNLIDPRDWFALDRLPGRGYEKWASTLGGVFLTVGLLFTFVGLSAALLKVGNAGADAVQLRNAISKILEISSAKFITSIAGIIAYIGWTLAARGYASRQAKAAHDLASAIQLLTRPLTPEALLFRQAEETRSQTERLKTFADDVAVAFDQKLGARLEQFPLALGGVLQPALKDSMQPVVDAIQGMGASIGEGNHSAILDMVSGMMTEVRGAAGTEMRSLVEAMQEAAGELRAAKSGIGETGTQFSQDLTRAAENMRLAASRVAATMETRAGELDARMHRIDAALSSGAESMGAIGGRMSEALEQGLRRALDAMAAASSASAGAARSHVEAQLAPLLGTLQGLMSEIRQSASDSRGELVEGGRAARADLAAAINQVGADLARTSAEASGQLSVSFKQAAAEIIGAAENSVAKFQKVSEELSLRMGQVEHSFAMLAESVRAQVGYLGDAGATITTAGRSFGDASDELRHATAPVATTMRAVEASANAAREAVANLLTMSGAMKDTAASVQAASASAERAFTSYEKRFGEVDDALGRTFERMRAGFEDLGKRVGEIVRDHDQYVTKACSQLGTGVSDLSDAVNDLAEVCGVIRRPPKKAA